MHKRGAHFQSIDTIAHATCYCVAACTTIASCAYQAVSVDVQACIPASVVECTHSCMQPQPQGVQVYYTQHYMRLHFSVHIDAG